MANGKLVWINFGNIDALTMLTKSFEVKSPNNVISILVDLAQKTKDIQLKQMRVCPTCNKEYEIEQITSGAYKLKDHIRHCDLDNTNCKQICKLERRIKLESKDKANGTNESNDNKRAQTDTKDKEKVKKVEDKLGWRNGIRITDMKDPDYDYKYFDTDIIPIREAYQRKQQEIDKKVQTE